MAKNHFYNLGKENELSPPVEMEVHEFYYALEADENNYRKNSNQGSTLVGVKRGLENPKGVDWKDHTQLMKGRR